MHGARTGNSASAGQTQNLPLSAQLTAEPPPAHTLQSHHPAPRPHQDPTLLAAPAAACSRVRGCQWPRWQAAAAQSPAACAPAAGRAGSGGTACSVAGRAGFKVQEGSVIGGWSRGWQPMPGGGQALPGLPHGCSCGWPAQCSCCHCQHALPTWQTCSSLPPHRPARCAPWPRWQSAAGRW